MRNPFIILGLSPRDIRALNDLPYRQRLVGLVWLRRFYNALLHPDITKHSGEAVAEINAALDTLQKASEFNKAYEEIVTSQDSGGYVETLKAQAQYWKAKAEKPPDPKAQKAMDQARKQIESLQLTVTGLTQRLNREQKQYDNYWKLTLKYRDLQKEHQKLLQRHYHVVFDLMGQLARDGQNAPEGATPLADLVDMTLERKTAVYYIDKKLFVKWKRRGESSKFRSLGQLMGCLTHEDMEYLGLKPSRITPSNKRYDELLEQLKYYFREGMHLVTRRKTGNLHIYTSIEEMVPDDKGKATTIETV